MVPERRIIHLDMDAFYASVEQRDDPSLRGAPVAVGGSPESRGVVAAASYEARRFGVRSAIPMARAVRLCPALRVVRPDFRKYRAVSQQVMTILRDCTPLVEPLSLDEAYLDVTDNRWGEPYATVVAKRLKQRIVEETGLTASAGVAPNKFLAKIASGWRKPDGLTVVAPARIEAFLEKLAVDALWGVGPVTARKLRAIGIDRLVDVRTADEDRLRAVVGNQAVWLRNLAYGIDPRSVQPHRRSKSMSAETTYESDLKTRREACAEIERLARKVVRTLVQKGLSARAVTVKVRYHDFKTITRSHTTEIPTADADLIAARAVALLERTHAGHKPVRLLGAGVHDLTPPEAIGPTSTELPLGLPGIE